MAIRWMDSPADKDYVAAASFLSLVLPESAASDLARKLRTAGEVREFAAKDVLRQSRLPLLPKSDSQVRHVLSKVRRGKLVSPILLVRGDLSKDRPLIVADGYHRMCAAYHLGDDSIIRCHIVDYRTG